MVISSRTRRLLVVLGSGFCLLPGNTEAADSPKTLRQDLLAGWPKYDPTIRKAHLEKQAVAQAESEHLAAAKPNTPSIPAPAPASAKDGLLVLPKMTVEAAREKPPARLPRLNHSEPVMNRKSEPFESPEARRTRLVKVHFTSFEQALGRIKIPLVSQSLEARAGHAEAIESAARELNGLAELLELSELLGLDSPEEVRALRAEFKKLYYSRPR